MKKLAKKILRFILVFFLVFSLEFSDFVPELMKKAAPESASEISEHFGIAPAVAASQGDGIIVYGKSGTSIPQYRLYASGTNTWGSETSVGGATFSGTPRFINAQTSASRDEAIVGVLNDTGTLYVVRWNGSTWSQLGSNIATGINPAVTKIFDITYEYATGDAMVVVGGAADPAYYKWNGSTWSGPTSITQATKTTGTIRWIELANRKTSGSNEIALAYADANGDLNALIWSGSAWTEQTAAAGALSTGIENNAAATTMRAFDLDYEALSGDLLISWGNSATVDPRYVTKTAAGVWSGVLTASTFVEIPSILNSAVEPWGDRIAVGLQNDTTANSNDGDCGIWNGSSWVNTVNCDIARDSQEAGDMVLGSGWVKSGSDVRAINFYSDAADLQLDYNYWVPGTGWTTTQAVTPSPNCISANSDDNSFVVHSNPFNTAEIMVVRQAGTAICTQKTNYAGSNTFNFANAGDGSSLATPSVSQYQPVGFAYFKYIPSNSPPTLSISQPDGTGDTVTQGSSYNVTYSLADTDNTVTAAFYYDTNNSGLDGTAITGACATAGEGSGVTCSWNTTGVTPGNYYVYGITNDGVNSQVSAYSSGQITIQSAGSLSVDIVDSGGSPVSSPSVSFSNRSFSWSTQQSTGTLGVSSQKIRVDNASASSSWTLSISATSGPTALWQSGGNNYDFNGSSSTGRLQVDASISTITPQSGCSSSGLSKGSATYFAQGSQDSINLVVASSAQTSCYWDITGVSLSQDIPSSQATGSYSIGMTLTAS